MKRNKFIKYCTFIALVGLMACTSLDEKVLDEQLGTNLVNDPSNMTALINAPYASLRRTCEWYDYWALQQVSTDETIVPTRGSDWYDNGEWIQLHLQTWTADHVRMKNVWNVLSQGVSRSNVAMNYIGKFSQTATTTQYINEAKVLRAYYMYLMCDLFGQVPYREADAVDFSASPTILNRQQAADKIIADVNAALPNLKTKAEVGSDRITKGAAQALLAKVYLNYEVWTGTKKYTETITACNALIGDPSYAVATDYWSMFQKDVAEHPEFILRVPMDDNVDMGSGSVWVNFTLHYNQVVGALTSFWNGPCTTSTFFDTWDKVNDVRYYDPRIKTTCGFNQGFLVGQQYGVDGTALTTRSGAPLIFVPEVNIESSPENAGIRVIKFAPNPNTTHQFSSPNDVPIMRISDIYLIRAEAKLRSGDAAGALADVNYLRGKRSAAGKTLATLTAVTLDDLLKERGFELYWEGLRRQDLIRFGKYGGAWQGKPATDMNKTKVYPIPTSALGANQDLKQNTGY